MSGHDTLTEEVKQIFQETGRIEWYRPHVDRDVLAELSKRSDFRGFLQAGGHLLLWLCTGTLAYMAFLNISTSNWAWSVPLLYLAMFAHGNVAGFMGGTSCHELGHRTVFKTQGLNEIFLRIYAFVGWWDHVWFKPSHMKHHQHTTFHIYDGEVVLPQEMNFKDWKFWLSILFWNWFATKDAIKIYFRRARGIVDNDWYEFLMPEKNQAVRRSHRNWARIHLIGHVLLAITFVATGHWFLVFLVNISSHYCGLLGFLCGMPQHYGMQSDVADHRRCCRTYLTRGLPAFLYWNMHYHVEHHMFPNVPHFNLPKLRKLVEHDMPPANVGLWATWKEMMMIYRKSQEDPNYYFVPDIPIDPHAEFATDMELSQEASGTVA